MNFLTKDKLITLLKWPPYSPDLNPIENIWSNLKIKLRKRTYFSISELVREIKILWKEVNTEFLLPYI